MPMSTTRDTRALFRARGIEKRIAGTGSAEMVNQEPLCELKPQSAFVVGIVR